MRRESGAKIIINTRYEHPLLNRGLLPNTTPRPLPYHCTDPSTPAPRPHSPYTEFPRLHRSSTLSPSSPAPIQTSHRHRAVYCAAENALLSAVEPSTCAYHIEFQFLATCTAAYAANMGLSDELLGTGVYSRGTNYT
ncbi:hypothetical protein B484DRAFT_283502 [Ochromonadaceae sp. CCMP2298]|nr:hypothetical protein B484DRAFT_283502 [Ochromonadaceae sp. CCMP2298]